MASRGDAPAGPAAAPGPLGDFDRDTAVRRIPAEGVAAAPERSGGSDRAALATGAGPASLTFAAEISPAWHAGRGPHGGYLAAMLLRALTETVADSARPARSLTVHYASAPQPGPVSIHTVVEREGRSLSNLSARMERDGSLVALALATFSVPWSAPEVAEVKMPDVAPPDPERRAGPLFQGAPAFTRQLILQRRIGSAPFSGEQDAMEAGAWLGLAEGRAIDALSLAFFSDAMYPTPYVRLTERSAAPTVDLTVHFRTPMPRIADPDPDELCLAHFRSRVIHEGFFEEDGVIWSREGTVLAQSRQLAILMALPSRESA